MSQTDSYYQCQNDNEHCPRGGGQLQVQPRNPDEYYKTFFSHDVTCLSCGFPATFVGEVEP